MTRFIDNTERRARIGLRHRLAPSAFAKTPLAVAESLTAVHGTDPGSTVLGILARAPHSSIANIEDAFYEERTLVRVLGMRRTVFAVDWQLAPSIWCSSVPTVVREQRRLLAKMLAASGIAETDTWIQEAESRLISVLEANPGRTSIEISAADPYLGHRVPNGPGGDTTQSVASRLLIVMSAEGRVLRGRPRGGWTSTQFTWTTVLAWRADWPQPGSLDEADEAIARSWLYGYGPATLDDFAWWTGWPKGRSLKAIDRAGSTAVQTESGPAFVLASDLDPIANPESWVALLPPLDSSTMGWKSRNFYLGEHAGRLFDTVGNGGPTVWVDGRIVGGWSQLDSGSIDFELFEDTGREATIAIENRAAQLEAHLGDVRIKPRGRRWTDSERSLRGRDS